MEKGHDTTHRLVIKALAEDDRPREKMMKHGIRALSNAELLAILKRSGNREETAQELSQRILNSAENRWARLGKYELSDLTLPFKGIGEAKAITILAALEISRRRKEEISEERVKISSSNDAYLYMYERLIDLPHEEFWILLLNRAHEIIDRICISRGGTTATIVDVKLILKPALMQLATAIILCHNHPSNTARPSPEDDKLTQKIKNAAELLDIKVLDHIIVCEDQFFSYSDSGKL